MCEVILLVTLLYLICDVNYFMRTGLMLLQGRLFQRTFNVNETTTFYDICLFQDVNNRFEMAANRLMRSVDFARFHFYDRTGIYSRSLREKFTAVQGGTLINFIKPISLFSVIKIESRIIYADKQLIFFEHIFTTLHDAEIRTIAYSRQQTLNAQAKDFLEQLAPDKWTVCPDEIRKWMTASNICSERLKQK